MNYSAEQLSHRQEPIDLLVVVQRLWQRRWWILAATVVCTAVSAIAAFSTAPTYRAVTVLVPAGSERGGIGAGLSSALGQFGSLASFAGINVGGNDIETEEALAVLRSRQFTESFIDDLGLMPVLFSRHWDPQRKEWKPGTPAPTAAQAYKYFDQKIRKVIHDKKTGLVMLQVEWTDREQAALWANELVRRLNAEMRQRALAKADASVGYLEKELSGTTAVASREAIGRLIEAQINQRMLANVQHEYAFRVVDKAMPPDARDFVRPKRLLMLVVGALTGCILSVMCVLLVGAIKQRNVD